MKMSDVEQELDPSARRPGRGRRWGCVVRVAAGKTRRIVGADK